VYIIQDSHDLSCGVMIPEFGRSRSDLRDIVIFHVNKHEENHVQWKPWTPWTVLLLPRLLFYTLRSHHRHFGSPSARYDRNGDDFGPPS
jgi:hypothetical protein